MWQGLDDGLEVLLGPFGRAGQGDDDSLIPDTGCGTRHHGDCDRMVSLVLELPSLLGDLHGVIARDAESMAWIRPGAVLCIIGATACSKCIC